MKIKAIAFLLMWAGSLFLLPPTGTLTAGAVLPPSQDPASPSTPTRPQPPLAPVPPTGFTSSSDGSENTALPSYAINLEKSTYFPEDKITVTVLGVTQNLWPQSPLIKLFRTETEIVDTGISQAIGNNPDTLIFTAPQEPGNYEFRLYLSNAPGDPSMAVAIANFIVSETETMLPACTLTAKQVKTDEGCIGVKLNWTPVTGADYYRLFRSEITGVYSYPLTDFDVAGTSYMDINLQPDLTYYYTVKPVLYLGNVALGTEDVLGKASNEVSADIKNVNGYGGFILMKVGSPMMIVNGIEEEVDPGVGTSPLLSAEGRVMVPARAIVEAIGGTVIWDEERQQIILETTGNMVVMTIGDKNYTVNDRSYKMDVAPAVINNRVMLPLRFAGEALNCQTSWFPEHREIFITYPQEDMGTNFIITGVLS